MGGGRNIFSIGKSGAHKLNPGELVPHTCFTHYTIATIESLIMIDDMIMTDIIAMAPIDEC
jgi:hypothetical protein